MAGWNITDVDWTSADTLRNRPLYQPVHDIIEAMQERVVVAAVGTSPTSIAKGSHVLIEYTNVGTGQLISQIDRNIDLFFTNSIFTNNSGNWDGQSLIPMWSEATMETAIGSTRPDKIRKGDPISAAWLWWMKECLDRMVWTKKTPTYESASKEYKQVDRDYATGSYTWAAAWTDASGAWPGTWTGLVAAHPNWMSVYKYMTSSKKNVSMDRARGKLETTVNTTYKSAIDWYLYVTKYTGDFDDESQGFTENAFTRFQQQAAAQTAARKSDYPSSLTGLPPEPDDPTVTGVENRLSWLLNTPTAIVKWDVTDGFEYVSGS